MASPISADDRFLNRALAGAGPSVFAGEVSKADAVSAARLLVQSAYPTAICAILYGSFARDRQKALSDVDLLIVEAGGGPGRKSCRAHEGLLFDIQAFGLATLQQAIRQSALARKPYFQVILGQAEVVTGDPAILNDLRATIAAAEVALPFPSEPCPDPLRFQLTGFVIGLKTARTRSDALMNASQLLVMLPSLYLRRTSGWYHAQKWALEVLKAESPQLAERLVNSFSELACTGRADGLVEVATEMLDALGGPIWTGFETVSFEPS